MAKTRKSVLFLGKADDNHCTRALAFCRNNFEEVTACLGAWGDPLPQEARNWEGDLIISYLSRWIVPSHLLNKAGLAAINFHPAPPNYPGCGCNNFALYHEVDEFGITCHHMNPTVDTGSIIAVKRFPVYQSDDVASLLSRTYAYQLVLFYDIISTILAGKALPSSNEEWTKEPYTRKELNALNTITPEMSEEEIRKRKRALTFGKFKPVVAIQGFHFEMIADEAKN